ncbi:NADP-dependent oxidoreductase [Microbacterium sp. LRZ72]|uniref:NADP-dependent oxidoreductase n=1 Tax=Microbacterium sp. LRZ72 TaxID=2942481 RepID=UPI0029B07F55|nr:NADP-dependent oxidoreductase [Microbacterium sp. LRZ72]MDX2377959.1 NADP-dependent oxidoreductase [Microbacterium sp. LRZ72]
MTRRWIAPEYAGIDALQLIETETPAPGAEEVTIRVRAAGVNPSDAKTLAGGWNADPDLLPLTPGQEVAGVITAVGAQARTAAGEQLAVGDEVIAFKITGGFADEVTVAAREVFPRPSNIEPAVAANLLHVGVVAAELLHLSGAGEGDTLLVHGASGSVGVLVVQLARLRGIRVIGTSSEASGQKVRSFGAEAVVYGDGLAERVRGLAPEGVDAAVDAAGTDEALEVSLELVERPDRVATLAPGKAAREAGVQISAGAAPASIAFREPQRAVILDLAARGQLTLPVAHTFPLAEAPDALRLVAAGHPGGKVALLP